MLRDISFSIRSSETVVLLGPSGCGKTTLLRLINRLEKANEGVIEIDGENIENRSKESLRRSIGYVIQDTGLLPHLNVKRNIELVGKISHQEISEEKVNELLSLIGLNQDVLLKRPSELSGGQQQRIGLARALAVDPEIILMDEPFSALDNITRSQLQDDFQNLKHLDNKTILLVTHDVQEAFKLGDRIVLLEDGQIQQFGTPLELLNKPANSHVEAFLRKDKFILSLQTFKHGEDSLLNFLNLKDAKPEDKKAAMEDFFKQTY
ncbi:MAG: ATP-binding cassette domain-containing protein [Cyclobacteriaceae bacterium]